MQLYNNIKSGMPRDLALYSSVSLHRNEWEIPTVVTFQYYLWYGKSQDSAVGIVTGYGLDDWGVGVW
jgi:hypothetical protein